MANALDATSVAIGGGIDLLPVVLALPLLGTLLLLVLGGRLSARASGWLATTMVGLAFLAATVVGADYLTGAGVSASDGASGEGGDHALEPVRQVLWHWMAVGEDLAEITLAAHDLPMMAAVPAEAVTTAPALMSDPRAQQLFGPSLSEMWDPEAVVGLTPMAGVVSAGTMLTWYDVAPGPDGFVPARPWTERRFAVDVALQLDGLSLLMVLLVTGVGFLIHLYSIGYMSHDADASRFFVYMSFFVFSMLTLVLAANFLVMFVGWELVGLCSYLLIGFWYSEGANADAGRKAFVVNRVGDFAFLVGLMLIWSVFGSLDYAEVLSTAWRLPVDGALAIAIAALLLAGA
ncbi:MAG: proton-conducting transporter membrane subunit, partial [Anaerolineae bacterium]